jgi:hypothetical protein
MIVEQQAPTNRQQQPQQTPKRNVRSNISAMISSFHSQIDHLSTLLDEASTSESLMPGNGLDRHAVEVRKCCRTMHEIFSRQDELEFLWKGSFHAEGSSTDDGRSSPCDESISGNEKQDHMRHREEMYMFVDDLVKLACLEFAWHDTHGSANTTLPSLIYTTVSSVLPNAASICSLNQVQMSSLMKRLLFLMQDICEEISHGTDNFFNSAILEDLKLLESLVTLVTEEITIEQLQHILNPSEATQVLLIPLELVSLSSSTSTPSSRRPFQNWKGLPSVPPTLPLRPGLLYALRVFIDFLLQNLDGNITREHQRMSFPPATPKPSIREWLRSQLSGIDMLNLETESQVERKSITTRDSQDSRAPSTLYGLRTFETTSAVITPDELEEEKRQGSQDSTAKAKLHADAEQLLSLLDRYSTSLLEETMELLQGCRVTTNVCAPNAKQIGNLDEGISGEGQKKSVMDFQRLSREQIESIMQNVHMSTDILLFLDSEKSIAADPTISSALCSLWNGMANFILDHMSDVENGRNIEDLQIEATAIFFRLTKSYFGVLIYNNEIGICQKEDEVTGLATMIFRVVTGPNGENWNEGGKELVALLLEMYSNQLSLRRVLYSALLSLTTYPAKGRMDEEKDSIYFSLLRLIGMDSCLESECTTKEDLIEDDPWKLYVRDLCFPAS